MRIVDWNRIAYQEAWNRQQLLFDEILAQKKAGKSTKELDTLVLCEHPPVYTLGKNGHSQNLLISEEVMNRIGATYFHIDRGGDITFHGPGQIVGYPILDLDNYTLSLREYIYRLEEVICRTIADFGLSGGRLSTAPGVWLDPEEATARKICAIGVKASRFVTMHGFAFNVATDLSYYSHIHPCGFVDKGVTSLEKELGRSLSLEEVKSVLIRHFKDLFPS